MGTTKYFLMQYDTLGTTGVAKRVWEIARGLPIGYKTYYYRQGEWRLAPGFYDEDSVVREITKLEAMMEIL